jgi:hypothetical protein
MELLPYKLESSKFIHTSAKLRALRIQTTKFMKHTAILTLFAISSSSVLAQAVDPTVTERPTVPPASVANPGSSNAANVDVSDAGAQRPIFLKTENISSFAGFNSKYQYKDNPLSSADKINFIETAMWMNTVYGGVSFAPIEVDDAVITPYAGISWTSTQYLESGLDGLDFYSTSAYTLLLAQHTSGWAFRTGVSYASDRSESTKTETYKEFYPNVGAMRMFGINDDAIAILDFSGGIHKADSDPVFGSSFKELENIDVTGSLGVRYTYNDLIITPRYSATHKTYTEGSTSSNDGREDLIHSISLKVDYPLTEVFTVSLTGGYSKRDSKGGTTGLPFDFESSDGGISFGINKSF